MSEPQKEFIKAFKRNIAIFLAAQFLTILFTLVGFYFNTNNTLENHTKRLDNTETEVRQKLDQSLFYNYKDDQSKRLDQILYEVRENRKVIMNTNS